MSYIHDSSKPDPLADCSDALDKKCQEHDELQEKYNKQIQDWNRLVNHFNQQEKEVERLQGMVIELQEQLSELYRKMGAREEEE